MMAAIRRNPKNTNERIKSTKNDLTEVSSAIGGINTRAS